MTTPVDGSVPVHPQSVSADQAAVLIALVSARSQESQSGVLQCSHIAQVPSSDLGVPPSQRARRSGPSAVPHDAHSVIVVMMIFLSGKSGRPRPPRGTGLA